MRCVKIEANTVQAVWSDTGRTDLPAGWMDIEGRENPETIVVGSSYDDGTDTFTLPPEE